MWSHREFGQGLKLLFGLAIFGLFVAFGLLGIIAGALVSSPWALWYHDPKIVIWPATVGMVLMLFWAAWVLLRPRIPNPFRKR